VAEFKKVKKPNNSWRKRQCFWLCAGKENRFL